MNTFFDLFQILHLNSLANSIENDKQKLNQTESVATAMKFAMEKSHEIEIMITKITHFLDEISKKIRNIGKKYFNKIQNALDITTRKVKKQNFESLSK